MAAFVGFALFLLVAIFVPSWSNGDSDSADSAGSPAPAVEAPRAATVSVRFATIPEGVVIRGSSGEVLGTAPVVLSFERESRSIEVELTKEGYPSVTREISLAHNQSLTFHLGQPLGDSD